MSIFLKKLLFPFYGWIIKGCSMKILIPMACIGILVYYRKKIIADWIFLRSQPRTWFQQKWKDWGEPFVIAAVLALIIRTFLLGPYKIPTGSMHPTFLEGDRIFVDKVSYRFKEPQRGDIIVFKYPLDKKKDFVKRLIGLPGDKIEIRDGKLVINSRLVEDPPFSNNYYYNRDDWDYGKHGQVVEVPPGSYFALGDNSAASSDSRNWGFVPSRNLVGKAFLIWWPPKRAKLVH